MRCIYQLAAQLESERRAPRLRGEPRLIGTADDRQPRFAGRSLYSPELATLLRSGSLAILAARSSARHVKGRGGTAPENALIFCSNAKMRV